MDQTLGKDCDCCQTALTGSRGEPDACADLATLCELRHHVRAMTHRPDAGTDHLAHGIDLSMTTECPDLSRREDVLTVRQTGQDRVRGPCARTRDRTTSGEGHRGERGHLTQARQEARNSVPGVAQTSIPNALNNEVDGPSHMTLERIPGVLDSVDDGAEPVTDLTESVLEDVESWGNDVVDHPAYA